MPQRPSNYSPNTLHSFVPFLSRLISDVGKGKMQVKCKNSEEPYSGPAWALPPIIRPRGALTRGRTSQPSPWQSALAELRLKSPKLQLPSQFDRFPEPVLPPEPNGLDKPPSLQEVQAHTFQAQHKVSSEIGKTQFCPANCRSARPNYLLCRSPENQNRRKLKDLKTTMKSSDTSATSKMSHCILENQCLPGKCLGSFFLFFFFPLLFSF